MKLLKYFAGSLIISFGVLLLVAMMTMGMGLKLPSDYAQFIPVVWIVMAILFLPLAKKIVRVE